MHNMLIRLPILSLINNVLFISHFMATILLPDGALGMQYHYIDVLILGILAVF